MLEKTEGRDKFCKLIQYQSRFWKTVVGKSGNKELASRIEMLFKNMQTARKLFRLFKGLNEYQKIMTMLENPPSHMDEVEVMMAILQRIGLFGFWFFDNLLVLSQLKVI
jgi:hypothetical protein